MVSNKRHLQKMQLEKQRLEYIKGFNNVFQQESFEFMLNVKEKNRNRLYIGIVAIVGSLVLGYYTVIKDMVGVLFA